MENEKKNIRILIVEDDEDDFYYTRDLLRMIPQAENWTIDWSYKYKDALNYICSKHYDIYFVDYYLGAKTGLDLLEEGIAQNCNEPIILLTGRGNQSIDMKAMQSGAIDYLIKSEITTEKLERAIRYALEKAQTLKVLRINEQKYRNIFEQSKDAIFLLDEDFKFLTVNETTNLLLQYSSDELLSMTITDLMADDTQSLPLIEKFQSEGEIIDFELEFVCKNGDDKICLFSASKIKGNDETPLIQGLLHDITKLRAAEKTVLLGEKMALAGRLVQVLAHEIRNPLTNITLSAEHLQKEEHYNTQEQYFEIIFRNSHRINEIITQLIHSSRPADVNLQPAFLQTVLDETITAATDRIILRDVKLQINYPDVLIPIMADKVQLSIAFLNIITNSIEAMDDGEGRLIISVHPNHENCEVRITDNGSGISEENQKKLFEPYFTSKRNGIGLGLAATLNILQSHLAKIEVFSLEGTGTTFSINLPVIN